MKVSQMSWPLTEPFVISRGTELTAECVVVQLESSGKIGHGEAAGVNYHGETLDSMQEQIESVRKAIEGGVDRIGLLKILPAGGARNAVDAALWDLEAKLTGTSAFRTAGFESPKPIKTCITIGIREIAAYEQRARELADHPWIKIKVNAANALEAIKAVRRGAPNAKFVVDPNQAWSVEQLKRLEQELVDLRVDLLEQPVPIDGDAGLKDYKCRIPLAADEAANSPDDIPNLVGKYDFINIKLDKTGGLTLALQFAHAAQAAGFRLMVGCMTGSSLAMAPGMVLAQLCEVVDLDGPVLQNGDWPNPIIYNKGVMSLPPRELWG